MWCRVLRVLKIENDKNVKKTRGRKEKGRFLGVKRDKEPVTRHVLCAVTDIHTYDQRNLAAGLNCVKFQWSCTGCIYDRSLE